MQNEIFSSGLFKGQSVLITGGGTGLGYGMADRLASLGATLHLCGRRQEVVDEAARLLQEKYPGAEVFAHSVDIRDASKVDALIQEIWDKHGGVDALVNNAAGNFICPTEELTVNGFKAITETVLNGTFYTTQSVGKRWIESKRRGSVLSIVVTWVWTGSPFVVPSAMSKSAVDTMTKSLAIEWGRHGIRFNAIAPGVIPTEGASTRLRPTDDSSDYLVKQNPMQRLGKMSDIAQLAAFLLCPQNDWINGQTIALDGGDWLANGAYFKQYFEWSKEDWKRAREVIREKTAKA
ncbi:oxidoreductase [Advenella faeciporci]|uniref:Oxidoreductase n=1 Tax=Advenella faeciporci TaxID=797535 RepID=A0A918JKA3_9BURK|nr:SDR family oxidoreductase [Advenella faeciporci]GGW85668.1 oxidoreductase [Advenella faeciporci]